jgi:hypothetical protein
MPADTAQQTTNAWNLAHGIGRLDVVTVLPAVVLILVGWGGIFTFFDARRGAKETARAEAETYAKAIAEATAVNYLEREFPGLVST